jgi:hypothetical protein
MLLGLTQLLDTAQKREKDPNSYTTPYHPLSGSKESSATKAV